MTPGSRPRLARACARCAEKKLSGSGHLASGERSANSDVRSYGLCVADVLATACIAAMLAYTTRTAPYD